MVLTVTAKSALYARMTTSPDRLNAHMTAKPTVLVTGVSGSLGLRLVEELDGFEVIGADVREPAKSLRNLRFVKVDLREERSCDQLLELSWSRWATG